MSSARAIPSRSRRPRLRSGRVRGLRAGAASVLAALALSAPATGDFSTAAGMEDPGAAVTPAARADYFLLAPAAVGRADGAGPAPGFAVVAQRRLLRAGETFLEREVQFKEEHLQVLHTERARGTRRTLTWRELQPGGARTWIAEWDVRGGEGRILGYGWRRPVHETFEAPEGLVGPLELLERLRAAPDAALQRDAWVIDPLAATTVRVRVDVAPSGPAEGRRIRVTREDTTLVVGASLDADGRGLDALRFSGSGAVARPVPRDEFERRFGTWNRPRVPSHERALAGVRAAR